MFFVIVTSYLTMTTFYMTLYITILTLYLDSDFDMKTLLQLFWIVTILYSTVENLLPDFSTLSLTIRSSNYIPLLG